MTLERLRRRAAQSDEQRDADGESDDPETSIDAAGEVESSGSRLGTIKKTVGVALVAATTVVAVRRIRRRRGE